MDSMPSRTSAKNTEGLGGCGHDEMMLIEKRHDDGAWSYLGRCAVCGRARPLPLSQTGPNEFEIDHTAFWKPDQ